MEGPLPIPFESFTGVTLLSLHAFCFCLSVASPAEQGPILDKDLPSALYIIQSSYLGVEPRLCVQCALQSFIAEVCFLLLLCQCSHNAKLKSSGPFLIDEMRSFVV